MTIGGREYKEVQIITEEGELISSITDEDIIEKNEYKVECIPVED